MSVIQPSAFFSLNIYIITGQPDWTLKHNSKFRIEEIYQIEAIN